MTAGRRARDSLTLGLALALWLAACSGTDASPSATATIPRSTAAASASASAPASPSATASAAPSVSPTPGPIAADPPALGLEEVATGLADPIGITAAPDGVLLVNEREGRVVAVDPDRGVIGVTLDIRDRVLGGGEQGLLGLGLHPDWPETPRAFVHYTDAAGDTVLSEFRVTDDPAPPLLDATTERVLLQVDQPYRNHNGGQLAFGPDGYLYMALGDGGSGGDPHGNGQNRDSLLGKILRIDVDGGDGGDGYAIPEDNPFADGGDGAAEVFLYGLRNPWRFSFDRATGHLWIGDVGQNATEEIDRIDPATQAGANLGWNLMEGSGCFAVADCSAEGLVLPVTEYGRDAGCSVTGGHVYRGDALPELRGWYLFSDYCTGLLFGVPSDADGVVAPRLLLETGANVSSFGEGPDGELYVADLASGSIYRIVSGR